MYDMVILLSDQGVYALATETHEGTTCQYFVDGIAYVESLENDQYVFISYLE